MTDYRFTHHLRKRYVERFLNIKDSKKYIKNNLNKINKQIRWRLSEGWITKAWQSDPVLKKAAEEQHGPDLFDILIHNNICFILIHNGYKDEVDVVTCMTVAQSAAASKGKRVGY